MCRSRDWKKIFEWILRLTENSKYILPMFSSSTIIVAEVVSMPLRQNAEPDSIPRYHRFMFNNSDSNEKNFIDLSYSLILKLLLIQCYVCSSSYRKGFSPVLWPCLFNSKSNRKLKIYTFRSNFFGRYSSAFYLSILFLHGPVLNNFIPLDF